MVVGVVLLATPVVAVFAALDLLRGDLEGMRAYFGWSVLAFLAYFIAKRLLRGRSLADRGSGANRQKWTT